MLTVVFVTKAAAYTFMAACFVEQAWQGIHQLHAVMRTMGMMLYVWQPGIHV